MTPRIEKMNTRKLVGKRMKMSVSENKTHELWKSFMPGRSEIQNKIGTDLFSMQIYDPSYFSNFNPDLEFEKWAAAEVNDFNSVPKGMEAFTLPGGMYAVFNHKGGSGTAPTTFKYIFSTWLPSSEYILDDRPHFEILGEKYKNDDPGSEEEIWIPVKPKSQD